MAKMNIENVVASTSLGQELNLNAIEDALEAFGFRRDDLK